MLAPVVYAYYEDDNPATKLGRGLTNIITSPGEYVVQTQKLTESHDSFTAYAGGIFQGTAKMLQRIVVGAYEVVTFPVPLPKKYRPVLDPPTTYAALEDSGLLSPN